MATLKQVAAHAEVSVQTVSNALNAPHRLRADTLERVNRSIELLNYRPNRNARSLRTSAVELIGYCVPNWPHQTHLVMDQFLHALCAAAERTGRHILLFTAPPGVDGMPTYDDLHARRMVDGFVLSQTETHDPRHGWLKDEGIPFVSFGRVWKESTQPGPWVDVDGATGSAIAVRHLYDTGRRRIAFLGWPKSSGLAEDRVAGWRTACKELGLPTNGMAVRCREDSIEEGALATARLLDSGRDLDGIVALSDVLALGALRELTARGIVPGRDVGVVGYDDSPLAEVVSPGLTSLRQPMDRIAEELITILTGDQQPAERLLLPELVIRGSSAPG
ncbi:LacI family DNA-binding transcriptional regulator [Kribbella jejuensis]|uniref:LacI family transcriptional regulator n=1 Tax=Kribbella jejuensis TaxID=236068 RepID=A0A542EQS3_9ACTN|nr:LacI family DNA-binding transcriptional regulator [Kribbella jejuensis]TQJ17712.1 LacI family transcriptional regulator [Kribbella jejuensis]